VGSLRLFAYFDTDGHETYCSVLYRRSEWVAVQDPHSAFNNDSKSYSAARQCSVYILLVSISIVEYWRFRFFYELRKLSRIQLLCLPTIISQTIET